MAFWNKHDSVDKLRESGNVGGLVKILKYEKDAKLRAKAVLTLGDLHVTSAMGAIGAALKDGSTSVREKAVETLGKIGDSRTIGILSKALQDEKSSVRKKAAESLGMIGDYSAVEPLRMALKDKSLQVRMAVDWALENIKQREELEMSG